jgi:hypothetical protein
MLTGPGAPLAVPVAASVTTASALPATVPASAATVPASGAPAAAVLPGASIAVPGGSAPPGTAVASSSLYPKNSQTLDEQARDRYECYRFAVTQTGFDPMRQGAGVPAVETAQRLSAYQRAQAACFEGRGYLIR